MTSRTVWLLFASIALAANLFADSAIGPAGGGVLTACSSCHGGIYLNATFASPVTALYPGQSAVYTVNIDKMTAGVSSARVGLNVYGPFGNFDLSDSDPLTYFSDQVVHSTFDGTRALHSFASSTSTSYQFGFRLLGPAPGTTIQLKAVSAAGHSAAGNEVGVAATTVDIDVIRPANPSGLIATAVGSTTVDLTWSGTGPGYRVVYKSGFIFPNFPDDGTFLDSDSTSLTIANLTPSATYTFAVYGRASFGVDTFSGDASFLTITTSDVTPLNYYVDAIAGSNANNGSSGAPWQTITHALTIVHHGDTVNVRQGTYNVALGETFPIVLVTGVKLVGTSGAAATIIDATGANEVVIACFACASNTLVEGFTVTRGLIDFTGRIASTRGGGGIAGVFNCHAVFRRNIVTRNEARGGEGTGFSVYGGGVAVRAGAARFENNVIANNIARGGSGQDGSAIQPVGGDGGNASGGGIWFEDAFDVQFVNNTVYGNVALAGSGGDSIPPNIGGRGGSAFGGGVGGTGYHAFNNIIVSNQTVAGPPGGPLLGPSGVSVDGGLYSFSASNTLHDNLFFHNQPNDANAPGVPAIFADPIFSSALTSDFHLSMLSPARGAGTPIGAPLRDLENTLRASPLTIGAYETGLLLTASPGIGRIVVTWPAVPGASSYNLYMSQTAGVTKSTFQKKVTGATSPYVLAPLPNNTTYYFVITAIENSVEGSISPEVSATSANGTWVKALAGMNFTAITTDMKNGMTLYAANDDLGVYKSSDGGDTWTNLPGTTGKIRGLAANGLMVFGAADTGDIFKSGNGGTSWATVASLGAQGEPVQSIAIDPLATNTIYTGDYPMGPYLFKSIDGGTSWNHLTSGALLAYVLQIDPVTAGTVWAAGTGTPNLSKSTDGGSTWSPAAGQDGSMSPAAGFVYALALAPSQPLTVYARITQLSSEPYGVHKTINGGLNWTLTSTGVPPTNPRYNALFVDPAEANRVHAGTELGYYTTTNGGSNWTAGPAGGPYPSSSLSFRAFAQTSNRRLLGTTNIPGALFMLALDPPPSISSVTPSSGSTIGGDSLTVGGSGFTIAAGLRVLFGGVDGVVSPGASLSTSIIVTTPANPFGTVDVVVINPDGQSANRAGGFTYNCPVELSPAAANYSSAAASGSVQVSGPGGCAWTATSEGSFVTITGGASGNGSGTVSYSIAQNTSGLSRSTTLTIAGKSFVVTQSAAGVVTMTLIADASPSQVALSWTSTPGAISYEIQRSSNGGELAAISSTGATAYTDPTVASGTGYLYRIRAIGSGGEIAYSNIDLAVPFTYTYPSIVSGVTIIHAVDVMELRQAANAARGALGWAGFSFMDSILAGMTVKNIHIEQVRFVIDGVRSGAGLSGLTYADPSITTGVTLIRRAHITEARAGLQ